MGRFPADAPDAPEVVVQTRCPPLKGYSADTLKKAGRELRGLLTADPAAASPGMIADYRLLREQCRAYAN